MSPRRPPATGTTIDRSQTIAALRRAGFVAAEEEADDLIAAADSPEHLASLLTRRLTGEPIAWVLGSTEFLGMTLIVEPGVYVPRSQTESIARHAASHLPDGGTAIDLCTGSGAVGAYLLACRPYVRVIGTDIDPIAVACARANGVESYVGDLLDFTGAPVELRGHVDLVVAVPPYVPEPMLSFLPRDVVAHEPLHTLVGGQSGFDVVDRSIRCCTAWLRLGGSLVVEVGIDQIEPLVECVVDSGLSVHEVVVDEDGDPRAVCATVTHT